MSSTFNVTEWVLKNTIKEGKWINYNNNISILLEYIDKNYNFLIAEYGKDFIDSLVTKFKSQINNGESESELVKIKDDAELEKKLKDLIDKFDKKKNNFNEKDITKYTLDELIFTLSNDPNAVSDPEDPNTSISPILYQSEDGKITLWSGARQEYCVRYGVDQPIDGGSRWCITQPGGSYWGNYTFGKEYGYPTFYLIKNRGLEKKDKLSFVAVQALQNGKYKYTNRENRPGMSEEMDWDKLNAEIDWLEKIPNLRRYIQWKKPEGEGAPDIPSQKLSYSRWLLLPTLLQKINYLVNFKNDNDLFTNLSLDSFLRLLNKNEKSKNELKNVTNAIVREYGVINLNDLLKHYDEFSEGQQKSIAHQLTSREQGEVRQKINIDNLLSKDIPFSIKKIITREKIWNIPQNVELYLINDKGKEKIIQVTNEGDRLKLGWTDENFSYSSVSINNDTSRYLLAYPRLNELSFKLYIDLFNKGVIKKEFLDKILEKASADENSAIIIKDTDTGKIVLDSNSFASYKIENDKITSIPFESEEIQNILSGEELSDKFQESVVKLVYDAKTLPSSLDKNSFLNILNNTPYNKRLGIARNQNGVILVNTSPNARAPIFVTQATIPENGVPTSIIDYGRETENWRKYDYSNSLDDQDYALVVKYYRETNQPFNDNQIKRFLNGDFDKAVVAIRANPLMAQDSTLKPVVLGGQAILLNTRDPRSSFIISDRSGKLLNKVISSIQARQILGTAAPQAAAPQAAAPAAGERRRGRPVGRAAQPAAPAQPQEGALNLETVFTEAGLQQGFQNMSPGLKRALANPVDVLTSRSRGATSRNNLLGNRGSVVRVLEAGESSIYIISLAGNNGNIASINIQPGNGHLVVLPNGRVLPFGSPRERTPNNLLTTLRNNNLAENLAYVIVSEFLAQNPTMIDEAKNALRLILKNKKS